MQELYCDPNHVVDSLRKIKRLQGETEAAIGDECQLVICDLDGAKAVAVNRGTLQERNIEPETDDRICVIERKAVSFGAQFLTLKFHESAVDKPFTLTPAGHDAIAADQASDPRELSNRLAWALGDLVSECDLIFTFSEVSSASMANGGHYTDFEFEYSIDGVRL